MALRRKIYNNIRFLLLKNPVNRFPVTDIQPDKPKIFIFRKR